MREYWLCKYITNHAKQLGLKNLKGPFDQGPDFKAIYQGRSVSIEAEIQYKDYLSHKHPKDWADILIVATTDPVPETYKDRLPPIIINVGFQEVLKWSEPLRTQYRTEMQKRRNEIMAKFPPKIQKYLSSDAYVRPEKLQELGYQLLVYPLNHLAEELAKLYAYYMHNVYNVKVVRFYTLDRETDWVSLEDEEEWQYWIKMALIVTNEFNIELSIEKVHWIDGLYNQLMKRGLSTGELKKLKPVIDLIETIDPILDKLE